ncbi:hypothetical protein WDU94_012449 [Cyamophila willieti]
MYKSMAIEYERLKAEHQLPCSCFVFAAFNIFGERRIVWNQKVITDTMLYNKIDNFNFDLFKIDKIRQYTSTTINELRVEQTKHIVSSPHVRALVTALDDGNFTTLCSMIARETAQIITALRDSIISDVSVTIESVVCSNTTDHTPTDANNVINNTTNNNNNNNNNETMYDENFKLWFFKKSNLIIRTNKKHETHKRNKMFMTDQENRLHREVMRLYLNRDTSSIGKLSHTKNEINKRIVYFLNFNRCQDESSFHDTVPTNAQCLAHTQSIVDTIKETWKISGNDGNRLLSQDDLRDANRNYYFEKPLQVTMNNEKLLVYNIIMREKSIEIYQVFNPTPSGTSSENRPYDHAEKEAW